MSESAISFMLRARGIDVDQRAKPEGQHQPEGNINDIALPLM